MGTAIEQVRMKLRSKSKADGRPPKRSQEIEARQNAKVKRLRCLNCGQHIFVAAESEPPEICQYCDDMTTWRAIAH